MENDNEFRLGVLALEAGLIEQEHWRQLCAEWSPGQGVSLTGMLIERGWLTSDECQHLERLLEFGRRKADQRQIAIPPSTPDRLAEAETAVSGQLAGPSVQGPFSVSESKTIAAKEAETSRLAAAAPEKQDHAGLESNRPFAGRYLLKQIHARGGVGQVWLAHDTAMDRDIALKELRPEFARSAWFAGRFNREARITGQLEHPGIVPVYEINPAGEGSQLYYTMRFLRGRTLSDAIRTYYGRRESATHSSVEFLALVNAFVAVCNTLAYAHHRGVIHRDLKGLNIIFGEFGEVIVLDWGLARRLGQSEDAAGAEEIETESTAGADPTLAGQILGTPAYMAPEQAAGRLDQIDERTDVYGLGSVLYEILTSRPPFEGDDTDEILERVVNQAPTPPERVNSLAPKPLAAICMKALSKRPAERYPTALALGQDVQRWLADEPVQAYPEPWRLRAARWARRHRTLVAAMAVLLCTAVAALAVSTTLIGRQRSRAEANLQHALDAVDQFFVQVSENRLLNEPGMQPLRRDLLQTAERFSARFVEENRADPRRRADLGRILLLLARASSELGDSALARGRYLEARTIFSRLVSLEPDSLDHLSRLAACHLGIGILERYDDPAAAEIAYKEAASQFGILNERDPNDPVHRSKQALALNNLAALERELNRSDEALSFQSGSLRIQEELAVSFPENPDYLADLAGFHSNLANLLSDGRDIDRALANQKKAHDLRKQLVDRYPRVLSYKVFYGQSLNNLGMLHLKQNGTTEAARLFKSCVEVRAEVVRRNPDVPEYRKDLGQAQGNLGVAYRRLDMKKEADAALSTSLATLEELAKDYPGEVQWLLALAGAYLNQAYHADAYGQTDTARHWYSKAIDLLASSRSAAGARAILRDAYWGRAMALHVLQRHQGALADWNQAIEMDEGMNRQELGRHRARARLVLGDHVQAVREIRVLARENDPTGSELYELALAASLAITFAGQDERLAQEEKSRIQEECFRLTMELLSRAADAGFFEEPANLQRLNQDKELTATRSRKEFLDWLKTPK